MVGQESEQTGIERLKKAKARGVKKRTMGGTHNTKGHLSYLMENHSCRLFLNYKHI